MILTVNNYLNARTGKASVNVDCFTVRNPGDPIDVDSIEIGDLVDNSAIWYHCSTDGCYYWSGGIAETEFDLDGANLDLLDDDPVMDVLAEAKDYFWTKYYGIQDGFTGIAVLSDPNYSLSFRFKRGTDTLQFPKVLEYKGFSIPLQITIGDAGSFTSPLTVGSTISAKQNLTTGTCGIVLTGKGPDNTGTYALTNFHVAAEALLKQNITSYKQGTGSDDIPVVMPGWAFQANPANVIGQVYLGQFDLWHDLALIRLSDPSHVINTTPDGNIISGCVDIYNKKNYEKKQVTMYGPLSHTQPASIISCNAGNDFNFEGQSYPKQNLIQITLVSQQGDSGSPVTLGSDLIGLVLGDDGVSTYLLPIQRILNHFNLNSLST